MFWTDVGAPPKIEQANLDGTGRIVIVNDDVHFPISLTVDYEQVCKKYSI